jgi:hypothetical protein
VNAATTIQLHHGGAACIGRSAAGSESPTGVHVLNPDGPAGEAARANQGLSRVRLKMLIAP